MRRKRRNTNFIDRVLYSQTKRKGVPVTFVEHTETLNARTGKKTSVNTTYEVKRAILLPDSLDRRFVYDLSYIATNKNFTYGALFDTANRKIIVRQKDLGDYVPKIDHYMLFEGTRWNIVQVIAFEYAAGFLLVGQRVDGAFKGGVSNVKARDRLVLGDSAVSELN